MIRSKGSESSVEGGGGAVSEPSVEEVALVAVLPKEPVFTLTAYRPGDLDLLAEQFPGCEARMLGSEALSDHARAEVRALLQIANRDDGRGGVVVGVTDGKGGWASWHLGFFAPKPGPVPELPSEPVRTSAQ